MMVLASLSGCKSPTPLEEQPQFLPITAEAIIGGKTIYLEVAETEAQQAKGLMFRDHLPENQGMLLPLAENDNGYFWMYNVSVPLDMLFLHNGVVKGIALEAPPCITKPDACPSYGIQEIVDSVIELRAGSVESLGVRVGDLIEIKKIEGRH